MGGEHTGRTQEPVVSLRVKNWFCEYDSGVQSCSINEGICGYDSWDSVKLGTFQGVSKWGEQSTWRLLMGPGQW